MYLKRLELHGFKSFANKTVLDFDPGLTAVVGPNGSGKSNIADAIRWVTGEQSLKLLRGKKSEDVIFAGSDKKSKQSMADVALTFDNKDKKLPFDYSEVVIARRLYRNGESEYLINNQRCRLLDIVDALLRSGFGATNYAVIGQGTIDQMVLSGPTEIKSLVEEASGVKPYYFKRDKTLRRLKQTEENLSAVSQLVNEIEPRLKSLRRQAKRMEEREAVLNELNELRVTYYGHQFYLLDLDSSAVEDQLKLKQKVVLELKEEIESFQKILEKEEGQSRKGSTYSGELSKQLLELEQTRYKLNEKLAEISGRLSSQVVPGATDHESLQIEKLGLERNITFLENKLKELKSQAEKAELAAKNLNLQIEKLDQQIKSPVNRGTSSDSFNEFLAEFEREFKKNLELLVSENVSEIKQKLQSLLGRLISLRKNSAAEPKDILELTSNREALVAQLHQLELGLMQDNTLLKSYSEQMENAVAKLDQIKSLLSNDPKKYKSELVKQEEELRLKLEASTRHFTQLSDSLSKLNLDEQKRKTFLADEEKKFRKKSAELSQLKEQESLLLVEKAKLETRLEALTKEVREALGEKMPDLSNFKKSSIPADTVNKINKLKHQLEMAGGVDEQVLAEYRETQERFEYLTSQSKDMSAAVADLRKVIEDLDDVIKTQFDEAYHKISEKFAEYFRILFNGGRAQMVLLKEIVENAEEEIAENEITDEEQPVKGSKQIVGIEIKATPPGKKLATITALSGGERALTAIALLCALLASYPSPFVVLDEVDAALDEANSIRFAKILGTLGHQTQFINITHNRETMRQAHTLYGVTMNDDGVSKILSLKLEQAEKVAQS